MYFVFAHGARDLFDCDMIYGFLGSRGYFFTIYLSAILCFKVGYDLRIKLLVDLEFLMIKNEADEDADKRKNHHR